LKKKDKKCEALIASN
jgi:hypothetical protein